MTPQEQQLIDGLVQRVNSTNLPDKDPAAEQRLQQGLGANPNALYILAQTVIVQQYALDQAKQQLDTLKQQQQAAQQQPPQKHTGFLESIFGRGDSAPPPPQPSASQPQQQQGYTPVPSYVPAPTSYPPAGYAQPASSMGGMGGGGGFLRGAAQTAAGVAAGALAFEGVESLLHGFGNSMVGDRAFDPGGGAPREEVINNYYGDNPNDRSGSNDRSNFDNNDSNPGDNIFTGSGDRNDQSNFADTSNDDSSSDSDTSNFDDNSNSFDDGSSFTDDSGSFDDGGGDLGGSDDNSF